MLVLANNSPNRHLILIKIAIHEAPMYVLGIIGCMHQIGLTNKIVTRNLIVKFFIRYIRLTNKIVYLNSVTHYGDLMIMSSS